MNSADTYTRAAEHAGSVAVRECAWCGAIATTTDEDGDPSCEQHAREIARPEVLR